MSGKEPDPIDNGTERSAPFTGSVWQRISLIALLWAICVLTYGGIADNYLFNDDFSWLREARLDMSWGNLLTHRVVDFFRPVINLSFYLMERASPGNVRFHNTFNLMLHFLNTLLVYHLVQALLDNARVSIVTAILFAITSVHTGAVLWISARTTLLSSLFLLASLSIVASRREKGTAAVTVSVFLYIVALAAKETAIAGFFLVFLLYLFRKADPRRPQVRAATLISFTAVSAAYLVIRKAVMGGFLQSNWNIGGHILRNAAGGLLYQFYPWPVFSICCPGATRIPEPGHPFIPEILVIPLAALLLWAGEASKKLHTFAFALAWTVLALLPAAPFHYRFFSTVSITQTRYYYLSSVGSVLLIALLLSILWSSKSRIKRYSCLLLFLVLCAGYMVRVDRLEKKWDKFTGMYREVITVIEEETAKHPGIATLAIEDPPLAFPYIADALVMNGPGHRVIEVTGGRESAMVFRPCLYISYRGDVPRIMRIEKLE